MRAALEDSGPKGTERPKELSINIHGKDGIYTAAVCSRCQGRGQWVWAQKVTVGTRENSLSLGVTVITGRGRGGRRKRKGVREGRRERGGREGVRGKRVPSAQNFPLSVHSQFPALFQISLP